MNSTPIVYGVDLAKNVFQMQWLDPETGKVMNRQVKRAGFLAHFVKRAPCLVGMEACGGSQQAVLALHRMLQQLVKFRTMQSNGLRGLLAEHGEVMTIGRAGLNRAMPEVFARLNERLPAELIDTLREQWDMLGKLDG